MGARHFLLAIATLLPAHLVLSHPLKDCSEPPLYFTVNDFSTFTPSSTSNASARISFYFGDASCSSNTILNPEMPKTCSDASYDYLWDGKSLTVEDAYIPCANEQIDNMRLFCYPAVPPYPLAGRRVGVRDVDGTENGAIHDQHHTHMTYSGADGRGEKSINDAI